VSDRLLIDECLSSRLVAAAKVRGYVADYGPWIGLRSADDWDIVPFAIENDYVVVTNNRKDFLKEHMKLEIHNGLIVIVPNAGRDDQVRLFGAALEVVAELDGDLMNRIVEVLADGTVHVREWAVGAHDVSHVSTPSW
jgi:predicted nuclease of predicted toxin-antitoxin system